MAEISRNASENVNRLLIGNKCDDISKKTVTTEEAKELADSLGIPFMETSAKTSVNVEESFFKMASEIKSRVAVNNPKPITAQPRGQALSLGIEVGKKKKACC